MSEKLTVMDIVPLALAWMEKEKSTLIEAAQKFDVKYNTLRGRVSEYRRMNGDKPTFEDKVQSLDDKIIEAIRLMQEVQDEIDPVITHHETTLNAKGKPVAILLAGCMQMGGRWTFHSMIKNRFNQVMDTDNTYIGLFGDEIDNFYSGSFAGKMSVMEQPIQPIVQRRMWEIWMDKIKSKALWGFGSQHGTIWDESKAGVTPIKNLYVERGVPFFDGQGYIKIHVGEQTYKLAASHEFPGNSMYNPNHPQFRALWQRYPLADVVAMADKHQYSVQERQYAGNEYLAGDKPSPYVYLVQIGTAKGGPDKYSIRGWERGQTEWPWMVLWPDEHKVKITRHFDDVYRWVTGSELKLAEVA